MGVYSKLDIAIALDSFIITVFLHVDLYTSENISIGIEHVVPVYDLTKLNSATISVQH